MLNLSDLSRLKGYRFPRSVIGYAVWAYHRFPFSLRDVEDLLASRGIVVSYETIPGLGGTLWCSVCRQDPPGPARLSGQVASRRGGRDTYERFPKMRRFLNPEQQPAHT